MKNKKINLTLPQEVIDMLEDLRSKLHISKTALVTIAIQNYYNDIKRKEEAEN